MGKAVMKVSRQLIEELMEPVKLRRCIACQLSDRKEWLHDALKLPVNAKIDGVLEEFMFYQIHLRIESHDFRENVPGEKYPEVTAIYRTTPGCDQGHDVGVFDRWEGESVDKPFTVADVLKLHEAMLPLPTKTPSPAAIAEDNTYGEVAQKAEELRSDAYRNGIPETLFGYPVKIVDNLPPTKRNHWEAE